jgi:hypothetical protein
VAERPSVEQLRAEARDPEKARGMIQRHLEYACGREAGKAVRQEAPLMVAWRTILVGAASLSAADIDLQLDAAYQPLLHVEARLRKLGQLSGDAELTALSEQVWSVVEELQRIRSVIGEVRRG